MEYFALIPEIDGLDVTLRSGSEFSSGKNEHMCANMSICWNGIARTRQNDSVCSAEKLNAFKFKDSFLSMKSIKCM